MPAIRRLLTRLQGGHTVQGLRALQARQRETGHLYSVGPHYIDPAELADALAELRELERIVRDATDESDARCPSCWGPRPLVGRCPACAWVADAPEEPDPANEA